MTFPQVQTSRDLIPVNDPRHIRGKGFEFLHDVYVPEAIVHPDAKPSDLLSVVFTSRLGISAKLKMLLEENTEEGFFQFLPMTVHYLDKTYEYWLLNPLRFDMQTINFEKSEAWLCGAGDTKVKKLSIGSQNDFEKLSKAVFLPERINIYSVKFKDNIQKDFIILRNAPGIRYYVSEILKQKIETAGLTGISFEAL